MPSTRLRDFDALSFDCYGTLIDWEAGLLAVLRPWAGARGLAVSDEQLLTVYGTHEALAVALENSSVSERVNTFFVERHNGTDRNRNGRKARKTYCFSKDWWVHEAVSRLTMYSYNFCWPVRTLRERDADGKWQQRTPAMAAGLADQRRSAPPRGRRCS